MRFVVRKADFLQGLQQVARAIPTRTPKPILYGVLLTAQKDRLYITGYDLEIGIQMHIENPEDKEQSIIQIEQEGSVVLQARYLIDIVRKLPHSLIRFDSQQSNVTIQSGTATYQLNGMDYHEYPDLPTVHDERGFAITASSLKGLIEHSAFAVASSEVRPTLTGVLWNYSDSKLTLTGTDSHRLSTQSTEVESHQDYAFMDSIIPGKSLIELSKILPDTDQLVDILIEDNQLLVTFLNTRFLSRLIEGKFPDTTRIIPSTFRTTIVFSTKDLHDSVERAALLARDTDNNIVRFQFRRNNIEVLSHSPEIGKVVESIDPITFEGEDMMIACNAKFMIDALRQTPTDQVRVELTGSGSPFVLRPIGLDDLLHLILPVRIANI